MSDRKATPAKAYLDQHVLSLSYRGALPDILRLLADKLESSECTAEHFTARVARETFEISASINLHPDHRKGTI
jgi:hypothetical protein